MISAASLIKVLGTVGAIGGASWVFDAPNEARIYVSEPLRLEFKGMMRDQITLMASMKHLDVRTDELAADVRTVSTRIESIEKYITDHLSAGTLTDSQHRQKLFLEQQRDSLKTERDMKIELLNAATLQDSILLQRLSRA